MVKFRNPRSYHTAWDPKEGPPLDAPEEAVLDYLASIDGDSKRESEAFRYACSYLKLPTPQEFIEKELHIVDVKGKLQPLKLNFPQRQLEALWAEDMQKPTGLRWLVLKARQEGVSTWTQAHLFEAAMRQTHLSTMTVAHRNKASDKIFSITRRFQRKLRFKVAARFASRREIEFEEPIGSTLTFDSAMHEDVGRAGTLQMVHLSEVAFWPTPEETFTAVLQTCHAAKGSAVVVESTANGASGFFHSLWNKAQKSGSEWRPIFLPWWIHEDYRLPFGSMDERADLMKDLDREEVTLIERYKLVPEQLKWRRWCIRANCRSNLDVFHQEYPSSAEEAFISTGSVVFSRQRILTVWPLHKDPIGKLRITPTEANGPTDFRVAESREGEVTYWKAPEEGRKYVVGVDPAEGAEDGSTAGIHVMDLETCEQVAEADLTMEIFPFADLVVGVARHWNNAYILCEANKDGVSVLYRIRDRGYWYIYVERSLDQVTKRMKIRMGWWTSGTTKPILIAGCEENLNETDPGIRSEECLRQLLNYPKKKSSRTYPSDLADARMLALQARVEVYHPKVVEGSTIPDEYKHLPSLDRKMWMRLDMEDKAAEEAR